MKFKGRFHLLALNSQATRDRIHKYMVENLVHVAFAWTSVAESKVPVWTGASKATFLHLAHAIGFSIVITPSPTAPYDGTGFGELTSEGGLIVHPDKGEYFFRYYTRLERLIENEYTDATANGLKLIHPGPYHFQEAGKAAFEAAAKDVRLPAPVFDVQVRTVQ